MATTKYWMSRIAIFCAVHAILFVGVAYGKETDYSGRCSSVTYNSSILNEGCEESSVKYSGKPVAEQTVDLSFAEYQCDLLEKHMVVVVGGISSLEVPHGQKLKTGVTTPALVVKSEKYKGFVFEDSTIGVTLLVYQTASGENIFDVYDGLVAKELLNVTKSNELLDVPYHSICAGKGKFEAGKLSDEKKQKVYRSGNALLIYVMPFVRLSVESMQKEQEEE
ncbi:MAG: hypothetical protein OXR68_00770 [Alphaproteobacteria bacterium]|nr:hypothetical protein [Alphaproteobacteria bacterium]MDD9919143.1 hypothetical protein [Alphaproteobacteria bacterium]